MIKQKKQGQLIVVSGPSGAGKDTIVGKLIEKNDKVWLSVSATSREPRGNEKDGENYFFLTREDFEKKIQENYFLEYAEYAGNYYGTPKEKMIEKIEKGIDVILVIEIQGAIKIKELMPEAIFIFIMPPSEKELLNRLKMRKTEKKEKIIERFNIAYKEINEVTKYNYVVVNDLVDEAVSKVEAIIKAEISSLEIDQSISEAGKNNLVATAKIKNTGNIDFTATGTLEVKPIIGSGEYQTPANAGRLSVIPEAELVLTESWDDIPSFGIFKATWTVTAGDTTEVIERTVFKIPLWFIVLIIILLTILTIWIIMVIRKRKDRRARLAI